MTVPYAIMVVGKGNAAVRNDVPFDHIPLRT